MLERSFFSLLHYVLLKCTGITYHPNYESNVDIPTTVYADVRNGLHNSYVHRVRSLAF